MAYGKNGATCRLAGAVRASQKRVEWLEARDRGGVIDKHAAALAPVVEHISQAPVGYTARAPVVEYINFTRTINQCIAVPAPDVEYISPAPAVYAAPAPVVEVHRSSASGKLRRTGAYSVRRTSSCWGMHFSGPEVSYAAPAPCSPYQLLW